MFSSRHFTKLTIHVKLYYPFELILYMVGGRSESIYIYTFCEWYTTEWLTLSFLEVEVHLFPHIFLHWKEYPLAVSCSGMFTVSQLIEYVSACFWLYYALLFDLFSFGSTLHFFNYCVLNPLILSPPSRLTCCSTPFDFSYKFKSQVAVVSHWKVQKDAHMLPYWFSTKRPI